MMKRHDTHHYLLFTTSFCLPFRPGSGPFARSGSSCVLYAPCPIAPALSKLHQPSSSWIWDRKWLGVGRTLRIQLSCYACSEPSTTFYTKAAYLGTPLVRPVADRFSPGFGLRDFVFVLVWPRVWDMAGDGGGRVGRYFGSASLWAFLWEPWEWERGLGSVPGSDIE